MPVDEAVAEQVAARTALIYADAEQQLIALVTRQLAKGDINTEGWQIRRLAQIGALRRAAAAIVARLQIDGSAGVRRAIATAYRAGNNGAIADLSQTLTPKLFTPATKAAREHRGGNTVQVLADALAGEIAPVHARILPAVEGAYRQVIASAVARSVLGVQDRRRAAQDAWAALVDKGITDFHDSSGRRWQLHSYVEMATRTAAHRAQTQAQVDEYTAANQRLVWVEDRPGECALCRPYEHKILTLWGASGSQQVMVGQRPVTVEVKCTLGEALAAGLQHPNCRHGIRLYVAGRTKLSRYTADEAGNLARARQRAIERHIRHWRNRELAALLPEAQTRARAHVRAWEAQMAAHLAATGLPRLRYREEVGAGHVPAARRGELVGMS